MRSQINGITLQVLRFCSSRWLVCLNWGMLVIELLELPRVVHHALLPSSELAIVQFSSDVWIAYWLWPRLPNLRLLSILPTFGLPTGHGHVFQTCGPPVELPFGYDQVYSFTLCVGRSVRVGHPACNKFALQPKFSLV